MKIFDTETWVTTRLEGGVVRTRVYVKGLVNKDPERWVTRSFDVKTPEAVAEGLSKVLSDRAESLEAAGEMAAHQARQVAVNRGEIQEVMQ